MSMLKICREGEPDKTIDLTPVEEIEAEVTEALGKDKRVDYCRFMKKVGDLDEDQSRYLFSWLLSEAERWSSLYFYVQRNPEKHLETVNMFRELKRRAKKQGVADDNFWPTIEV